MIQLNLLPDIKQQYLKTRRIRTTIVSISIVIVGAVVGVLVLLFITTNFVRQGHIDNLSKDIDAKVQDLRSREDVAKILTVQNQLNVITSLHDSKPDFDKVIDYLPLAVPEGLAITELNFDFVESKFILEGETLTLEIFNKLIDAVKFTDISPIAEGIEPNLSGKAFSDITFNSTRDSTNVKFKIEGNFVPEIFLESEQTVKLTVPDIISTRSTIENPNKLFTESSDSEDGGGN